MKVAMAADHAGWRLKDALAGRLRAAGHEVLDLGAHDDTPSDYPTSPRRWVRRSPAAAPSGASWSAAPAWARSPRPTRCRGILAGLCHDTYSAHQGVEHDQMNVLALGARVVGEALAVEIAEAFVAAAFDGVPAPPAARREGPGAGGAAGPADLTSRRMGWTSAWSGWGGWAATWRGA